MMKRKLTLLFFGIFTLIHFGFAQLPLTDVELDQLNKNEILEAANQNALQAVNQNDGPLVQQSLVSLADLDDDGMDDSWEMTNGFDPTDPHDAWDDADGDHILNLFEFQLSTNPNNPASPNTIDVTPAISQDDLEDIVRDAENSLRVIRMAEGTYNAQVLAVFEDNFRFMAQGGWNSDFTEHDPDQYPTNWAGQTDEPLRFLKVTNQQTAGLSIIVEGINFTAIDYFSLAGPLQISINSGESKISVYDCTFNNNTYYGFSIVARNFTDVDAFLVNSVFGNNVRGGLYTQSTDDAFIRWRFMNSTINNPGSPEGGLDGLTLDNATIHADFINTINWGNNDDAMNFSSNNSVSISIINSNLDLIPQNIDTITFENGINMDPEFTNVAGSDWSLAESSPCIDAGIDIGLPFNDDAPDMGAIESGSCFTSSISLNETACDTFSFEGMLLSESGTYTAAYLNVGGCDSIITLNLNITEADSTFFNLDACEPFMFEGEEISESGTYVYDYSDVNNCDSILILNAQIFTPSTTTQEMTACNSFLFDGMMLETSGTYTGLFLDANGCDSTVMLNLTIETIDTSVTIAESTLTANMEDVNYEWIDCTTNTPVPGATGQSFTPTVSGTYAVNISSELCSETSECFNLTITSLNELKTFSDLKVFPNPVEDIIGFNFGRVLSDVQIALFNVNGQQLNFQSFDRVQQSTFDLSALPKGVYFLNFSSKEGVKTIKMIKN